MALEPFTTADDVRAAVGLSSQELSDETLSLGIHELTLKAELNALGATLIADFVAVDSTDPPGSRTTLAQAFHDATRAFAPYAVASRIFPNLPLIAVKTITDGKASISRQAETDFSAILSAGMAQYNKARAALQAAYAAYKGTSAPASATAPTILTLSRGTDPVTNT